MQWTIYDYILATIIIFGVGTCIELISRSVHTPKKKRATIGIILLLAAILWVEIAVGIF